MRLGPARPVRHVRTVRSVPAFLLTVVTLVILGIGLGAAAGQPLTLLHFNDFHGQLEPYPNPETGKNSGGIARLAGLIEAIRAEDPRRPLLLLFAGDLLQGSIRLTRRAGRPDEPSAKDPRLGVSQHGEVTSHWRPRVEAQMEVSGGMAQARTI